MAGWSQPRRPSLFGALDDTRACALVVPVQSVPVLSVSLGRSSIGSDGGGDDTGDWGATGGACEAGGQQPAASSSQRASVSVRERGRGPTTGRMGQKVKRVRVHKPKGDERDWRARAGRTRRQTTTRRQGDARVGVRKGPSGTLQGADVPRQTLFARGKGVASVMPGVVASQDGRDG
ncbi:hypothetical protein BGZ61DRAFT_566037 [Ilyonectria robusta]|uniref:uncharacterized protein n=1 Tax=Ilyonectria robusta TaxID=1079257 RepID=UPI001E8E9544|nr:uncharacterized protein BGZ61DRAFT_566037 [Ilyonectria robusta]KAH8733867.1 hypothetical protein BGZ61DRAFT_566037 [Ilyonectria robusta]